MRGGEQAGATRVAAILATVVLEWLVASPPLVAQAAPTSDPAARVHIQVNANDGDDSGGDGTADKPFRTIGRALALHSERPERAADIHLGLGHYGRTGAEPGEGKSREVIPLVLPPDVSLVGFGSEVCEIVGEYDKPLIVLADRGECRVSGVTLKGAATAVVASPLAADQSLRLRCVDLSIRDCPDGIDLAPAAGAVTLRGEGLRVRGAKRGLHAVGSTQLELELERSVFRDGVEGLSLDVGGAPEGAASHALALSRCTFERNAGTALRRFGSTVVPAAPPPWKIEECRFMGNQVGIGLEVKNGDLPLSVVACDFLENELYGVSFVGSGEPFEGASRLEDCAFRWNGIGVNLLSCGRKVEVARCRIEDSTGNGVFAAIFVGQKTRATFTDCVLACNGACGLFGLTERKEGLEIALERCTVADNRGHGVERKNRKSGTGEIKLARCIVAGNAADLTRIEPDEVKDCLIGTGPLDGKDGNVVGDPKFLRRSERDFRVAADSPARRADGVLGAPLEEGAEGGGGPR